VSSEAAGITATLILGLADVMHGRTFLVEASADGKGKWTARLSEGRSRLKPFPNQQIQHPGNRET